MKKVLVMLSLVSIIAVLSCKKELKTDTEKFSYAVGYQIGRDFKNKEIEIDAEILVKAINDATNNEDPQLGENEIVAALNQMSQKIRQRQIKKMQELQATGEDTKEGKAFLEENKTKPGVKVTASGLQYKILKKGKGKSPKATDTVKVHYKGSLINGKEFDSSYKRKQPAVFPLNGVIAGWTEGLQLMKKGAVYEFTIPSVLAYGPQEKPDIPANSVLVFKVELLDIINK